MIYYWKPTKQWAIDYGADMALYDSLFINTPLETKIKGEDCAYLEGEFVVYPSEDGKHANVL